MTIPAYGAFAAAALIAAGMATAEPETMATVGELRPAIPGGELLPSTRITLTEAEITALHARPGRVKTRALEPARRGGGLRYQFIVNDRGRDWEVVIDAQTGQVLQNRLLGPARDDAGTALQR